VLLCWWSGYLAGWGWVLIPVCIACGGVVFLSTAVLLHSLAFWCGPMHTLARQMFEWTITTTVYPASIYSGPIRWLMFVVLPAAFVSQLPVTLLREFRWATAAGIVTGTVAYAVIALVVFNRGLRVYTSGNRFVAR
jgi:ABC-2 type transport system permease protein